MILANVNTRFIILMVGRSGSSYLTELLSSHPQVIAKGEKPAPWKAQKQLDWTRRYLTQELPSGKSCVGFKLKRKDIKDPETYAALLRELDTRIILLRRRNIVKLTISWFNSERLFERTGQWNLYHEQDRLAPLVVDPVRFTRRLHQMEHSTADLESYVADLALPTCGLHYEDILHKESHTLDRIFEFLDIAPSDTTSFCMKNTSDDLRVAVSNFEELRSMFLNSHYLPMFDEQE